MNELNNLRPELWGLAAAVVMVFGTRQQLCQVSRFVKWPHWVLLAIYYAVGMGAFRFLGRFFLNHNRFVKDFEGANVLQITPSAMSLLALGLGVAGTVLLVVAIPLARFRRRPRFVFSLLVVPVSALYPLVTVTASGVVDSVPLALLAARIAALLLVALGMFAILFYRSEYVSKQIQWS